MPGRGPAAAHFPKSFPINYSGSCSSKGTLARASLLGSSSSSPPRGQRVHPCRIPWDQVPATPVGRSQIPFLLWCPPPTVAVSHPGDPWHCPSSCHLLGHTAHKPCSSQPPPPSGVTQLHESTTSCAGLGHQPHILQVLGEIPNFNKSPVPAPLMSPWTGWSSAVNVPTLAFQHLLGISASRAALLLGSKEEHGKATAVVFCTTILIYSWVPELAQRTLSNLSWIWGVLKLGSVG